MVKLTAFDLDGTLLSSFGTLSAQAADTLRQLHQQNILVVISSGRPYYSIAHIIPSDCYDYASCLNGQEIYTAKTGAHQCRPNLSEEEKTVLAGYLKKYRMMIHCSIRNQGYYLADEKHRVFLYFFQFFNALYHKLARQKYYPQEISYQVDVLKNAPVGKLCFCGYPATLRRFYHAIDPEQYSCFFVNSSWLEISHHGISKGTALQEIQKMENLKPEDCAAFGDGENDIPMLDACGVRVAMKNGMRSLKRHATAITALPCSAEGCARWVQDHLLSEER